MAAPRSGALKGRDYLAQADNIIVVALGGSKNTCAFPQEFCRSPIES
jgi:hypothetical protein